MKFRSLEDFVGGTPLVQLKRLPGADNDRRNNVILAKLEGNNPAGSVKDRPALSMIRRAEERGNGLRVALISPGGTATPLLRQVREAFGRRYDPAEALPAEVVATAVADLVTGPSENWRDEVEVILPG